MLRFSNDGCNAIYTCIAFSLLVSSFQWLLLTSLNFFVNWFFRYPRKSAPARNKLDLHTIIKYPLTTESAMKKIEDQNTLCFIVDVKANKHQIKEAISKLYQIKVLKVSCLYSQYLWNWFIFFSSIFFSARIRFLRTKRYIGSLIYFYF